MAFELPLAGSGLPTEQGVPYIGAKDNNNRIAVGAGMYWKNASGVWVPASVADPIPTRVSNGTNQVQVNSDGSLPVQLTGSYDQLRIVNVSADTVVPAGTFYKWRITGSDFSSLKKFPFFAVVLSWKTNSTDLNWDLSVWQYMTNNESSSTAVPYTTVTTESLPKGSNSRTYMVGFRNLGNDSILIQITNNSLKDQILSNLYVVGVDAI